MKIIINKEDILIKLDELEQQMPKSTEIAEEEKWSDRVMQFVRQINSMDDFFQIPPHISNHFAQTCRTDYIHSDTQSWRDNRLGGFFTEVSEEAKDDLLLHRRKGRKDFFDRYREFLIKQFEYLDNSIGSNKRIATKTKRGRPPAIKFFSGSICDGQKNAIISKKYQIPVSICRTILELTDSKARNKWVIGIDEFYEAYEGNTGISWGEIGKQDQEKTKKLLRNHVPKINNLFKAVEQDEWLHRTPDSIERLW